MKSFSAGQAFNIQVVRANPTMVWIVDECQKYGGVSVTNAAEEVVAFMQQTPYAGRRIIYRDTEGRWDELAFDADGRFTDFKPGVNLQPDLHP